MLLHILFCIGKEITCMMTYNFLVINKENETVVHVAPLISMYNGY